MEVLIVENAAVAAMLGAGRVAELLAMKPSAVLGLATGSTPIAIYQELVSCYRRDQISFADVVTFNLDEYVGLTSGSPQSYRSFMDRELFDHVDISSENTHFPACHPGDNPRLGVLNMRPKLLMLEESTCRFWASGAMGTLALMSQAQACHRELGSRH